MIFTFADFHLYAVSRYSTKAKRKLFYCETS